MTTDRGADGTSAANAATVSATGTGEVTVDASLTMVSIAVTTTTDSADEARDTVADDVAAVRATLTDAGIAEDAVQTTGFDIYPEYDYNGQERELLGYRAAHTLRIKVAPDRAGEVINLAAGVGASEIRGVVFMLADEKHAEFREEALTRAVNSVKADAGSVADTAGPTVTGVHIATVDDSASLGPYPVAYAEDAAHASFGSTGLSPGSVTISATVQMVYEVESE